MFERSVLSECLACKSDLLVAVVGNCSASLHVTSSLVTGFAVYLGCCCCTLAMVMD